MPTSLTVKRRVPAAPARVFQAWTDPEQFKKWFLTDRIIMHAGVDGLFWWNTKFEGKVWPHYGRWLKQEKPRLVELTWMSEATAGLESIVRVELQPDGSGTAITLTHSNLPDDKSRGQHEEGWKQILATLDDLRPA